MTRRGHDGRFAFVERDATIDVMLSPRAPIRTAGSSVPSAICFVGVSLSLQPCCEWRLREPGG
jgi:hypothetical protein